MNVMRGLMIPLAVCCSFLAFNAAGQREAPPSRERAQKLMQEGNWKEAYDLFARLVLNPPADPRQVDQDLNNALQCMQRLGNTADFDEFVEKAVAAQGENFRVLEMAARWYMEIDHHGTIVAGKFARGPHRGGQARFVNAFERDRVRALQLQRLAAEKARGEKDSSVASEVFLHLAQYLLGNRGFSDAWRLQYLTDLVTLPDYDEGYYYGGGSGRGAPVNEDGSPVFYSVPEKWEQAKSDGERWRWALSECVRIEPRRKPEVQYAFADFLRNQFDVQTMQEYRWLFGRAQSDDDTRQDESGPYAVQTLGENETIAKLATGAKRFTLPDEFNFIRLYKELTAAPAYRLQALTMLATIFEDRRQYEKSAAYWKQSYEIDRQAWRQEKITQILGNWGQFEPIVTQATGGKGATVDFRFRNGTRAHFEAFALDVPKLLADVKEYIKSNPKQMDWARMNIADIGFRIVTQNQAQYVGERVAAWDLPLTPRPDHFDRRVTVATPLANAGAYLLTAKMEDGNTSRIVIWVADTLLVKKPLDKGQYYFVADARTGAPVARANLEFFGFWQEWKENRLTGQGAHTIHTQQFAEFTDADGQFIQKGDEKQRNYQWIVIATTPEGRLAFLGFTGAWWGNYYDQEYNQTKVYTITDRPVYRPAQRVKFKFWVAQAQYDQEGKSPFAGQSVLVRINNPRGEKVFEKNYTADEYGGLDGEFALEKEATLGVYQLYIEGKGGGAFRVEEYKKPEFEVKVDAPAEPVMLGDKILARIEAKYYFGAPVTEGKVKYKVIRTEHTARWFPVMPWDWLYGGGYWWFAYDYTWYPGWREWGCLRPQPWWIWRQPTPPEIVAEAEVPVGKDGTVKVEIDTAFAKAAFPHLDHRYEITAEVTDSSRRTIVGQGSVLVARKPFKVYAWVDRGHYRVGDVVHAFFKAQTLDRKPVKGDGDLRLVRITYDRSARPIEQEVQRWTLGTTEQGTADQQIKASKAGQYRLSYKVTDAARHTIEGGYVFVVRGEGEDAKAFRFDDIELVPNQREYRPGESVSLLVNTDRADSTVLLFIRPANGIYLPPKVLRLRGKSVLEQVEVVKRDMPNFFIEAVTIGDGRIFTDTREIVVPPEKRVVNVEVSPSSPRYKPGEQGKFTVRVTDMAGRPFIGSTVVSIYDKSVEYISGGSNVPEIRKFFWEWRRRHQSQGENSLKYGHNVLKEGERGMDSLGVFGHLIADEETATNGMATGGVMLARGGARRELGMAKSMAAPAPAMAVADGLAMRKGEQAAGALAEGEDKDAAEPPMAEATVRTAFADTALWVGAVLTDRDGRAEVELKMPENLTTWKARVWTMGNGARVGEGTAEVVTTKNLIIRLQAPRFFVEKDEVVLSANVHNYLKGAKNAQVLLELGGDTLEPTGAPLAQKITVAANGEQRVDWRVKVLRPGEAVVRMKALTDEESDAMEMKFPVYVHGMLKTESFSGAIRPEGTAAVLTIRVPAERKPEQTRLEVRYSPTLAGAMVDALPYLVDYPYLTTESTLNRFLPTVLTQRTLQRMGLNLKEIEMKRTNLNAQEIGDDLERAKQWQRFDRNPVFDEEEVRAMAKAGVARLTGMQNSDGGWGWFSGWGEHSDAHMTALVVHGLQLAQGNDVALVPGVLERGVAWLKTYQAEQLRLLRNAEKDPKVFPWKDRADNLDAFIYMVLADAGADNREMRDDLYRDRNDLAVYAKAMFGIALHKVGDLPKRDMIVRNIEQFLVQDDENQTAFLKLPENNWWWCWYGSEYEAQAYYLKLLMVTEPKAEKASRLVKYLLNNRKHATYWNSTRDTAIVVEAFADYLQATGEMAPDMTVAIRVDGQTMKEVRITKENLFYFDNKLVLGGAQVATGDHRVELRKQGTGPLYFNAYLTNFTLEDPITRAGLEIKVNRKVYKLIRADKTVKAEGGRGQAVDLKVEKFVREELPNLGLLKSGDLVEIELELDSKNDYEYILFEDMKAAGFEPVEVRSGYNKDAPGAYVEFRDERVAFFMRTLARGKNSVSYRLRAEIPGVFSALPARGSGVYAPELKANSDEIKLKIVD